MYALFTSKIFFSVSPLKAETVENADFGHYRNFTVVWVRSDIVGIKVCPYGKAAAEAGAYIRSKAYTLVLHTFPH